MDNLDVRYASHRIGHPGGGGDGWIGCAERVAEKFSLYTSKQIKVIKALALYEVVNDPPHLIVEFGQIP